MYEKLDKIREDLKKAQAKRDAADAKVKSLESKLREEESLMIVNEVAAYKLSPEQLAQFLQLVGNGRLQDMISGQIPMPSSEGVNASEAQNKDLDEDTDKEDYLDEENE